jgi:methyltransferase (TIGR00027 family)
VFEIDQQAVIDFKTGTLSALGAKPTAEHRPVAVDLREDWPSVLRANGFYETRSTTLSAEGLLAYLPPDAQDFLFDEITAMSAQAAGWPPSIAPRLGVHRRAQQADGASVGEPRAGPRQSTLMCHGERNPAADYLLAVLATHDPDPHKTVRGLRPKDAS